MRLAPFIVFLYATLAPQSFLWAVPVAEPVTIVSKQADGARKDAQTIYNNLVSGGYFEKLGITTLLPSIDITRDTELLLNLVEYLESRNDEQSRQLLAMINKLFYLKLHQFVTDIDKKQIAKPMLLVNSVRTLYSHKVGEAFPFQTMLTKMFLQLTIVDRAVLPPQERDASVVLVLQQGQEAFLKTNTMLTAKDRIDDHNIKVLIDGLMQYALTPEEESIFVKERSKLMTAAIVVVSAIIIMGVGYYLVTHMLANAQPLAQDLRTTSQNLAQGTGNLYRLFNPENPNLNGPKPGDYLNTINNAAGAIDKFATLFSSPGKPGNPAPAAYLATVDNAANAIRTAVTNAPSLIDRVAIRITDIIEGVVSLGGKNDQASENGGNNSDDDE
ncbi:MAG: hypothetical protein WCT20_02530 [Candidatus Babeliales bacterium]